MQALEDKTRTWAWHFWSASELRSALEEYTEYVSAQGAPPDGGDPDPTKRDRAWRIWAQNRVIDAGMRDLLWSDRLAWKVLNLYYRQDMWGEFRGWVAPARALGLDVPVCLTAMRCQVSGDDRMERPLCRRGRECAAHHATFEDRLSSAIDALFLAVQVRQKRTLDSH